MTYARRHPDRSHDSDSEESSNSPQSTGSRHDSKDSDRSTSSFKQALSREVEAFQKRKNISIAYNAENESEESKEGKYSLLLTHAVSLESRLDTERKSHEDIQSQLRDEIQQLQQKLEVVSPEFKHIGIYNSQPPSKLGVNEKKHNSPKPLRAKNQKLKNQVSELQKLSDQSTQLLIRLELRDQLVKTLTEQLCKAQEEERNSKKTILQLTSEVKTLTHRKWWNVGVCIIFLIGLGLCATGFGAILLGVTLGTAGAAATFGAGGTILLPYLYQSLKALMTCCTGQNRIQETGVRNNPEDQDKSIPKQNPTDSRFIQPLQKSERNKVSFSKKPALLVQTSNLKSASPHPLSAPAQNRNSYFNSNKKPPKELLTSDTGLTSEFKSRFLC